MSSIHNHSYKQLIAKLKSIREIKNITQKQLAGQIGKPQSFIAKVETCERRLDIIELLEWLSALEYPVEDFFAQTEKRFVTLAAERKQAIPLRGIATKKKNGVVVSMQWGSEVYGIALEGVTVKQYLKVENLIGQIFSSLNTDYQKNREAILAAFELAFNFLPNANPSDVFQHVVYRIYLREYIKTNPEQSWRRASGEAMELFIANRYSRELERAGIRIVSLISGKAKAQALDEMGLKGKVGNSKLDIVLYGNLKGKWKIFGGIHCKASLAERVSDDVPCSEAMIEKGLLSILYTFDSKSFPPPAGDLINRGELGTPSTPSDKRKYIEEHGSFDACFSYNLRTVPSEDVTMSGKKIFVCNLKPEEDKLPSFIIQKWAEFKRFF